MNQFRIVADSSCDLLTLDGADFVSVPLSIRTDAEEFYDDANLDVDAMVSTLRDTKGRSYSACPNIADWESAFGESGNVIAFTITSALSGSYNAACVAKKNCEERNPAQPCTERPCQQARRNDGKRPRDPRHRAGQRRGYA